MQVDEKALGLWIREQATVILEMYRFDTEDDLRRAGEAFDILRARLPNCTALAYEAALSSAPDAKDAP